MTGQTEMSTQIRPLNPTQAPVNRAPVVSSELAVVNVTPAVLSEWEALEAGIENTSLMCSSSWTRNWLKHYGDLVPHRVAISSQNGEAVGMTLLATGAAQHDGPFPIRTMHFGTAGEPDLDSVCVEYNRLLVDGAHRATFINQLMLHIQKEEKWECLVMNGMAEEDAQAILAHTPTSDIQQVPAHYCDLNAFREFELAGKEPWRMFGESTRTNLRRAFRDLGELTVDWSESTEQALAYYEELIGYHQSRWQAAGKPGVFSSQRFTEFHRDLITELVPQRRAVLVRARKADKVLGILYVLIEANRLLYYQAGLPDHQSKLSLGCVTQYLTMLQGSRRGYDAFDFMAGDTLNKRVLSTHQNSIYWARWRRPSVKFKVIDGLRSLKNMLGVL
jgi:CelD/BcsL family acetyltransferase involved in cellulose biosynthesis